jgi:hypothetical protein
MVFEGGCMHVGSLMRLALLIRKCIISSASVFCDSEFLGKYNVNEKGRRLYNC